MFGTHKHRTSTASASVTLGPATNSIQVPRSNAEETKSLKIKKKVKFNPKVEIFEYNPDEDEDDDDTGFQHLEAGDKGMSEITDLGVYACDFSETPYWMQSANDSVPSSAPGQELSPEKFNPKKWNRSRSDSVRKPIENQSQWNALLMQSAAEDSNENSFHPSPTPCHEPKDVKFHKKRLNGSQYCASSVMKPIQNLSRLRAVKSRGAAQFLMQTEKDSTSSSSRMRSYTSKYKHKDCRVSYGEEDEIQRKREIKSKKTASSPNAKDSRVRHLPAKEPMAQKLNSNVRYRSQYLNQEQNAVDSCLFLPCPLCLLLSLTFSSSFPTIRVSVCVNTPFPFSLSVRPPSFYLSLFFYSWWREGAGKSRDGHRHGMTVGVGRGMAVSTVMDRDRDPVPASSPDLMG